MRLTKAAFVAVIRGIPLTPECREPRGVPSRVSVLVAVAHTEHTGSDFALSFSTG